MYNTIGNVVFAYFFKHKSRYIPQKKCCPIIQFNGSAKDRPKFRGEKNALFNGANDDKQKRNCTKSAFIAFIAYIPNTCRPPPIHIKISKRDHYDSGAFFWGCCSICSQTGLVFLRANRFSAHKRNACLGWGWGWGGEGEGKVRWCTHHFALHARRRRRWFLPLASR